MTIGSAGMYVVSVVLPAVQAEFGVARADASLPYTLMMIGFGVGCVVMGKLADRFGIDAGHPAGRGQPGAGFVACGMAGSICVGFALAQGVLLGCWAAAATFAPLVADTSLWFVQAARHRGGGVRQRQLCGRRLWPPVVQHFVETVGWRPTYIGLGLLCVVHDGRCWPWAMRAKRPPAVAGGPATRPAARCRRTGPSA
jgi:MFS family permease